MVRRAASYLVCAGPVTQQDRWEEDAGYSPFTLAAEIAALLAAAALAELAHQPAIAAYLSETADIWYANIDRWIYASNTELARSLAIEGYYVRIAPPETSDASSPLAGFVAIKNRPPDGTNDPAVNIVSADALALVRFGLREAGDPRIVRTLKAIDQLVKVELPQGPGWHRYNHDGYGEHQDGKPFDGTGIGRAWPLLTGERAHFELAAGRTAKARRLLATFRSCANASGLLPEQTWDADAITERELARGRPAGSAMPLVWAHAEYVKLLRSLRDGRVFDLPPQTFQRYLVEKTTSRHQSWRFNNKCRELPAGKTLRLETKVPAQIRWSSDGWKTVQDLPTVDTTLGMYYADLSTANLSGGTLVEFTFFWPHANRWEGTDFRVSVTP
jgi:glucoamylase